MITEITYIGDGVQTDFNIPFEYAGADVQVDVDDVTVTATIAGVSTVRVSPAPANGAAVRVYRNTNIEERAVDFSDGAVLTEDDLDKSATQAFWKLQELVSDIASFKTRSVVTRTPGENLTIPSAGERANKFLAFNTGASMVALSAADAAAAVDPYITKVPGPAGPANATFKTLAEFKAQPVTNLRSTLILSEGGVNYFWTAGDYSGVDPGELDDIYIQSNHAALTDGVWKQEPSRPTFTELASTAPGAGAGLVVTENGDTVQDWLNYITGPVIYAAEYGVVGDDATDNTSAMIAAIAAGHAASGTLILPEGIIRCGDIGNLASPGFTMKGAGLGVTVLKATHTSSSGHAILPSGTAFFADAFESGSPSDPFIEEFNLLDFTFEGNANTTNIFWFQGIARSNFKIEAREAGGNASKAFHLRGCMSNTLELICSTNRKPMTNIPDYGVYMDAGSRAGSSIGQCSNNLFIRPMMEGPLIGIRLAAADQNTFMGGASQGCTQTGLSISNLCRYNTFIAVAFENALSDQDVADQGIQTQYLNCYSVKTFLMQGKQPIVKGGYFERFELSNTCEHADVSNIRINAWDTGAGGWVDNGAATKWRSIYDHDLGAYIYPQKARTGITVGASPFTWTNTTGLPVRVHIQTGTITQVLGKRGADTWFESAAIPMGHYVAPNDSIVVSWSVEPQMSYTIVNGI